MKLKKEPIKVINACLTKLIASQSDVLVKRYGLNGDNPWTLEAIGKSYPKAITRERVRQREVNSLNCLRQFCLKDLKIIYDGFFEIFSNNGGAVRTDFLLDEMVKYFEISRNCDLNKKAFYLLLKLNEYFKEVKESNKFYSAWVVDISLVEAMHSFIDNVVVKIEEKKDICGAEELLAISKEVTAAIPLLKKYAKNDAAMFAYINISKDIENNVFGDWGLKDWAEISPKGVRDRAYLILRKYNKPMHFIEITKLINESNFKGKLASPQTVHNELIKDDKFILVGKGIYALKKWGYISGTVRELLKKLLQNIGAPMLSEKLVEEVLKQREVKKATVLLNLHDRKHFERLEDGRYIVKK